MSTIAALALVVGLPTAAHSLGPEDQIFILPCDETDEFGQLYGVDPVSGQADRVGSWVNPGSVSFNCAGPATYDPVTGDGYWIAWLPSVAGVVRSHLIRIDLETGVNEDVGRVRLGGITPMQPIALAIDGDGNAWINTSLLELDGVATDFFARIDLQTASVDVVGPTGTGGTDDNYGLAWNPVTDTMYAFNNILETLYTVNTATGEYTTVTTDGFPGYFVYDLAFDSDGDLWATTYDRVTTFEADLISAPLSDIDDAGALEFLALIDDPDGGPGFQESLIISYPFDAADDSAPGAGDGSELAKSGPAESVLLAGALLGFGSLVLGALVIARRRRAGARA